jgi:hypothetical protein
MFLTFLVLRRNESLSRSRITTFWILVESLFLGPDQIIRGLFMNQHELLIFVKMMQEISHEDDVACLKGIIESKASDDRRLSQGLICHFY